jgi:hypothetical protein
VPFLKAFYQKRLQILLHIWSSSQEHVRIDAFLRFKSQFYQLRVYVRVKEFFKNKEIKENKFKKNRSLCIHLFTWVWFIDLFIAIFIHCLYVCVSHLLSYLLCQLLIFFSVKYSRTRNRYAAAVRHTRFNLER